MTKYNILSTVLLGLRAGATSGDFLALLGPNFDDDYHPRFYEAPTLYEAPYPVSDREQFPSLLEEETPTSEEALDTEAAEPSSQPDREQIPSLLAAALEELNAKPMTREEKVIRSFGSGQPEATAVAETDTEVRTLFDLEGLAGEKKGNGKRERSSSISSNQSDVSNKSSLDLADHIEPEDFAQEEAFEKNDHQISSVHLRQASGPPAKRARWGGEA